MVHPCVFSALVGKTFSVMYSTDASFPINFTLCKSKCFLKFLNQSLLIKLVALNDVLLTSAPVITWKHFFLQVSGFFLNYICITYFLYPSSYYTLIIFSTIINYSLLSYELCTGWNILWKNFYIFLYRICTVIWVNQVDQNLLYSSWEALLS